MLSPTVLVCGPGDWDPHVALLRGVGLRVAREPSVSRALAELGRRRPDLVLLDTGRSSIDLDDVCRQLRAPDAVPLLVACPPDVHGLVDDVSQLRAYAAGADDVVAIGVSPRVLLARVGAVLRRTVAGSHSETLSRDVGPFHLDRESRTATCDGGPLDLTRIEFDLLGVLLESPRRVVPRAELLTRVWGPWFGDDHVIEVHLSRLRSKVVRAGGPRIGVAVRGVGYRLGLGTAVGDGQPPRIVGTSGPGWRP